MVFSNKNILVISPEPWGVNKLSKHHYSIELAKKNNQVFFLNPPAGKKFSLTPSGYKNISIVDYTSVFRGLNRIISIKPLFNFLSQLEISKIKEKINSELDIIWNFDPYRFQNLKLFNSPLTIFHSVDFIQSNIDLISARNADLVLAVSLPILSKYKIHNSHSYFVNHGVSSYYLEASRHIEKKDQKIRCGYIGNLAAFGMHQENLITIIKDNPAIDFQLIGPYGSSNLSKNPDAGSFIDTLKNLSNVLLLGQLEPKEVATRIQDFDLFLICYDPEKVGHLASNNHKLLEYLSTGKVVVSSRISTYDQLSTNLFEMVSASKDLPALFKRVIGNLAFYNSSEFQMRRIQFARQNSYENHVNEIEAFSQEILNR